MEEQIKWGAIDCIDERNYSYSEIAWNTETNIADYVLLDNWVIQDQYKSWYSMWCVYFASSMHDNYINARDEDKTRTTWWELCELSSTRNAKTWDYLINWPKLLKKLWHIEWYFQVETLEEIKKALNENKPIHVWSNRIDWTATRNSTDNIAVIWQTVTIWHAFHIIWYNQTWKVRIDTPYTIPNNCLICKNSSTNYDHWLFYIRFEDFDKLFRTKNVFENSLDPILSYKKRIMKNINLESAKKLYELWAWNWERPTEHITREECAAMVYRMYEKIKNNE